MVSFSLALVAQFPGDPIESGKELLTYWGVALGVIVAGAFLILIVDRWRRHGFLRDWPGASGKQLTSFRAMYEQGELSKEEYERIRSMLGKKMRQEMKLPDSSSRPAKASTAEEEPPIDLAAAEWSEQAEEESEAIQPEPKDSPDEPKPPPSSGPTA